MAAYLEVLQKYLRGEEVPFEALGFDAKVAPDVESLGLADAPESSRIAWLPNSFPKVEVEVAATGPKVIGLAAYHADRIMFALGAEPDRIAWGIETARAARAEADLDPSTLRFGSYVNLVCHEDVEVARELVAGSLTTFARFQVMHGKTAGPMTPDQQAVLDDLHSRYDMKHHTQSGSAQTKSLTPAFIDRYAVVGPASHCVERLSALAELGVERVIVIGPSAGSDREQAILSERLVTDEVLPAFA
jgi:5,10-methylenetetrahydromethanopterin reductase